ncbi:MAG: GNAT family N-acetyltransferase [Phototrophicaceae bacterium]
MLLIHPATRDDSADIVHIHINSWNAQFPSFLTSEHITLKDLNTATQLGIWQARFENEEGKTRFTFIAVEDDSPIGYITGIFHDGDYDAQLHQIYVLPTATCRGIGRQLVATLAQTLYKANKHSLFVWVMTINPAVQFYRDALAGTLVTERIIPKGDGILKEAKYVWSDIQELF